LNWSSPKDATWIHDSHTMNCHTVGDIYLLLKSSDFIIHDLLHAWDNVQNIPVNHVTKYQLILRKWSQLHPSMEFRCFVSYHTLIAISQRHHSTFYPHLLSDALSIKSTISLFFEGVVKYRYALGKISNYIFDVYVDRNNRVWILDFNVWASQTDGLLFTWEELVKMTENIHNHVKNILQMRIVENEYNVKFDPLASYRAPIDAVHIASEGETFTEMIELFQNKHLLP